MDLKISVSEPERFSLDPVVFWTLFHPVFGILQLSKGFSAVALSLSSAPVTALTCSVLGLAKGGLTAIGVLGVGVSFTAASL